MDWEHARRAVRDTDRQTGRRDRECFLIPSSITFISQELELRDGVRLARGAAFPVGAALAADRVEGDALSLVVAPRKEDLVLVASVLAHALPILNCLARFTLGLLRKFAHYNADHYCGDKDQDTNTVPVDAAGAARLHLHCRGGQLLIRLLALYGIC